MGQGLGTKRQSSLKGRREGSTSLPLPTGLVLSPALFQMKEPTQEPAFTEEEHKAFDHVALGSTDSL